MLKDKSGFVSIWTIIWMAILIPFLLFIVVDYTFYMYEHNHLKSVTDNAAASAVTQISEDMLKYGTVEIDEAKAILAAQKILIASLDLEDDLSPSGTNTLFMGPPTFIIKVFNEVPSEGIYYDTPGGTIKISKKSVLVYAEYPVKGVLFKKLATMQKIGVSQVQFGKDY